jgi:hypothetical protein
MRVRMIDSANDAGVTPAVVVKGELAVSACLRIAQKAANSES